MLRFLFLVDPDLDSQWSPKELESAPPLELAPYIVEMSPESELPGSYLNSYPPNQ